MRIQNIKNGAQYTDGSFHYSLFFSPQPASATQLPTECICSNTINVTFADCLLAFYLNGNSALAAAAAAAPSPRFAGVPLRAVLCAVSVGSRPGAAQPATPAAAERWRAQLGVRTCVSTGGLGRALKTIQDRMLLGETLLFLPGFSKTLILPAKCKMVCCCDGTERQMISGVSNSWF